MAGNIQVLDAYLYEVRSKSTVKLTICTLYTVHICVLKYVGVSFFSLYSLHGILERSTTQCCTDPAITVRFPWFPTSSPWIARYLVQYRGTITHFKSNCINIRIYKVLCIFIVHTTYSDNLIPKCRDCAMFVARRIVPPVPAILRIFTLGLGP